MSALIHPSAIVDPAAELGSAVRVGPYAVIGAKVEIGDDTEIGPHCLIEGPARIGRQNRVLGHACLGLAPQHLEYQGEDTELVIGDRNQIREFTTINRGTSDGGGRTTVGSDNLIMTGAHIAHDCNVGSNTVFSNSGTLAGHVDVGDWAAIGAFTAVHPFTRVGQHAYVGGFSVIILDVLPFSITVGQKARCVGVNRIGLKRRGFGRESVRALERAFRVLLRSGLNTSQALDALRDHDGDETDRFELVDARLYKTRGNR